MMGLIVLISAIWMAVDSSKLGYDKRDIQGLAAIGPAGWFFAGLLLWIVAFPLYLIKRNELKEAGERRRRGLGAAHTAGYLPPPMYGQPPPPYGQPPPPYGQPPPPYGQPPQAYGQPPQAYGQPPQAYGQPPQAYGQPPQAYGQPPQAYGQPPQAYGQPNPPEPSTPLTTEEVGDQIYKLSELRDAGILTEEEFEQQKAQILDRMQ